MNKFKCSTKSGDNIIKYSSLCTNSLVIEGKNPLNLNGSQTNPINFNTNHLNSGNILKVDMFS